MHLARPELQRHIVIRDHAGEAFRDAPHHDEGRGAHAPRPVIAPRVRGTVDRQAPCGLVGGTMSPFRIFTLYFSTASMMSGVIS